MIFIRSRLFEKIIAFGDSVCVRIDFLLLLGRTQVLGMKVAIPMENGATMHAHCFFPRHGIKYPLPGVVVGVGVGSQEIPQYQDHCQNLADRDFIVLLVDPSNYPEELVPSPYKWDRGFGFLMGSINQGLVAAKLRFDPRVVFARNKSGGGLLVLSTRCRLQANRSVRSFSAC